MHPGIAQLAAQRLEQPVQCVFAGVVGGAVGHRGILRKRAEHDDLPVPGDQAGQCRLGAMQRAVEIHRHHPLEHRQAGVGHRAAMGDAGIVDQHVDAAVTLDHQRHRALHRLGIADVATQPQRLGVVVIGQVLHQAIQRILMQIEDHQPRASLGHAYRQGAADSCAAAGDQHQLAVEHLAIKHLALHTCTPRPRHRALP